MNVLLMADIESVYTRNFISRVLYPNGWKVILLSIDQADNNAYQKYASFISENKVIVESLVPENGTTATLSRKRSKRIPLLYKMKLNASRIEKEYPIDLVSIQFITTKKLLALRLFGYKKHRYLLSFWGSDLLRCKKSVKYLLYPKYITRSVLTTCDSKNMEFALKEVCHNRFVDKIECIRFPNMAISCIQEVKRKFTFEQSKTHLGFPADKITIAIGYNATAAQQHLKMLASIAALPQAVLTKIHVVVPMTYGQASQGYLQEVSGRLDEINCSSEILFDFMQGEFLAVYYHSIDLFIHSQISDAFSQTLVDHIYAGSRVMQAKWLHSSEIDEYLLPIDEFESFTELTGKLESCLLELPFKRVLGNSEVEKIIESTEMADRVAQKWAVLLAKSTA